MLLVSNSELETAPYGSTPHNGAGPARPANGLTTRTDDICVIAHELNNSLAVVRGAARLLRQPVENDGIDAARALIERHVEQMSRHIGDLLDTPPGDTPRNELHFKRVDLRAVARDAVDSIAAEVSRRGHRLTVKLPEEPVWMQADAARLEQAFSNVLINAAKYTPDGGDIALTLVRTAEGARLQISDSGVGIEPTMLPRVFDLFAQSPVARSRSNGGRGIGLSVVRKAIEQHGGTVRAMSAGVGQGSEFTITLVTARS